MDKKLLAAALAARENAYAPYSKFKVGAAVETADGHIFTGCNVENASYGLTCCAERNAVFAAIGSGARSFKALCVVADTEEPVAPCGACRQVLAEFPFEKIILANCKGLTKIMTVAELLPYGFGPEALELER
ncbi:cytidine deaminase [uncultured Phascolarctobacterium sp.]|jgi:cytidine deaminase|uniref:cytidine deaminase n=1 Tax=uncultured Phascolarctobacterium sp. TaxID=512296 RepID=UPI0015AEF5B5|nr:cytidine deaminase [uncultured Phascolarctobacterium sp.]